jgi:hypothetical protein
MAPQLDWDSHTVAKAQAGLPTLLGPNPLQDEIGH